MFRELTEAEKKPFQQWARDNYTAGDIRLLNVWHPEVIAECNRINREAYKKGDIGYWCGWCGLTAESEEAGTQWDARPYDYPRCRDCGGC